jgi:hypothetical protein
MPVLFAAYPEVIALDKPALQVQVQYSDWPRYLLSIEPGWFALAKTFSLAVI